MTSVMTTLLKSLRSLLSNACLSVFFAFFILGFPVEKMANANLKERVNFYQKFKANLASKSYQIASSSDAHQPELIQYYEFLFHHLKTSDGLVPCFPLSPKPTANSDYLYVHQDEAVDAILSRNIPPLKKKTLIAEYLQKLAKVVFEDAFLSFKELPPAQREPHLKFIGDFVKRYARAEELNLKGRYTGKGFLDCLAEYIEENIDDKGKSSNAEAKTALMTAFRDPLLDYLRKKALLNIEVLSERHLLDDKSEMDSEYQYLFSQPLSSHSLFQNSFPSKHSQLIDYLKILPPNDILRKQISEEVFVPYLFGIYSRLTHRLSKKIRGREKVLDNDLKQRIAVVLRGLATVNPSSTSSSFSPAPNEKFNSSLLFTMFLAEETRPEVIQYFIDASESIGDHEAIDALRSLGSSHNPSGHNPSGFITSGSHTAGSGTACALPPDTNPLSSSGVFQFSATAFDPDRKFDQE